MIRLITLLILFFSINTKTESQIRKNDKIKIFELPIELKKIKDKKITYDFFGITSNGIDCIYFVQEKNRFNIEFEVISEEQKAVVPKLLAFSAKKRYRVFKTTYNNKPKYESKEYAPVYCILIKGDIEKTAKIGTTIMKELFKNNELTMYEIVP